MNMKKILFISKTHGLCNRLRSLVGFHALSRLQGVPFAVCWVKDNSCNSEISDIFEIDNFEIISRRELDRIKNNKDISIFEDVRWFNCIWEDYLKDSIKWEDYRKIVCECFDSLTLKSHIQEKVNTFLRGLPTKNLYGIHIRMTDNLDAFQKWQGRVPDFNIDYISTLPGFEKYICDRISADPSANFFLATDNPEIDKKLKDKFPDKVYSYKKEFNDFRKKTFSWRQLKYVDQYQRTTSIDDALIDIYLLTKCREIVGTYFSSFSKFSAVWGRVPYYEVRGDNYVKTDFVQKMTGLDL